MAKRSRVVSADRKTADAVDPPRTSKPGFVISDKQKLAIVGVAAVLGIFFGLRVSNHLFVQQAAHSDAAIRERALAEHKVALDALDTHERQLASRTSDSDGTAVLPPKWRLVIEKVILRFPGCSLAS